MDLKQLSYFKTIVEEGSILKAAQKLYMSQPPLSNQMKLLEEELGCVLFERGSRQIKLTLEGVHLYERCKDILELSDLTKKEIKDIKTKNSGTIRIGLVSSVGFNIIDSFLKDFLNKYKDINLEIFEANTYELIDKLNSNLIDLAFIRSPYQADNLSSITLVSEEIVAIGDSDLFNADTDIIKMKDLVNKDIITYRRWYNIIRNEFETKNIKLKYKIICDDARTTLSLVNSNVGLALVPKSASVLKNNNKKEYKIDDLNITSDINLVYLKDAYLSNLSRLLINDVLGKLPSNKENKKGDLD